MQQFRLGCLHKNDVPLVTQKLCTVIGTKVKSLHHILHRMYVRIKSTCAEHCDKLDERRDHFANLHHHDERL